MNGRRTARSAASVGLFIATYCMTAAGAEPKTAPLTTVIESTAGSCLNAAALARSVETFLGRSAVDSRIRIQVDRRTDERPRFVVRRGNDPPAERSFKSTDLACADLRAAVALAIALAIDASIMQGIIEPEVETPVQKPSRPPPRNEARTTPTSPPRTKLPPTARRVEERRRKRPLLEVGASVLGLFGVLPATAVGAAFDVGVPLTGPYWLRGAVWGSAPTTVAIGDGVANLGLLAGDVDGCYHAASGRRRLRACAGVAAGRWSADGSQFLVDRSALLPWVALRAGLELGVQLSDGLSFHARASALVPFVRPSLDVRDTTGQIVANRDPAFVGASIGTGLTLAF